MPIPRSVRPLFLFLAVIPGVLRATQPTPVADANRPLFEKAQKLFQEKNYKEAKNLLNQVVAKASPMEDYIPKARLLLAKLQEDFTVSIGQFQTLAAEYSNQPEGAEAQKDLGARYYLADKYPEAAQSYKEYLEHYSKSPFTPEARYWYASSLLALDQNDKALDQFKTGLHDAPDSSWAPKSLLGMGTCYYKMKKYEDAQKQYLRILDQYHLFDEMNLVYLKLGQTYEAQKKYKEAHAAYQTLVTDYSKSFEVSEAKDHMRDLEAAHSDLSQTMAALKVEPTVTPLSQGFGGQAPTPVETPAIAQAAVPTATPEIERNMEEVSQPFHVQVGVFSKKVYVEKAQKGVKKAGYQSYVVTVKAKDMPYPLYKVRVGNFVDKASAQRVANELTKKLKEKALVVED